MSKLKYKVGDKVRIKSLDWYNENKGEDGIVELSTYVFTPGMSQFCGKVVTIEDVFEDVDDNGVYYMEEIDYDWTDGMIEGLVEEEVFIKANDSYNEEYSKGEYCHEQSFKWGFQEGYNYSHENDKLEMSLKEGYQFVDENGNVINAQKIALKKKKPKYPKTYEECCEVLSIPSYYKVKYATYEHGLHEYTTSNKLLLLQGKLNILGKLLICRDAYWKLYGEEMGLGKSWEPDWRHGKDKFYCITTSEGEIVLGEWYIDNKILAFPTAEIRDAFKENFDPDIEICKEFL